jgi:hypothetical protein
MDLCARWRTLSGEAATAVDFLLATRNAWLWLRSQSGSQTPAADTHTLGDLRGRLQRRGAPNQSHANDARRLGHRPAATTNRN